MKLNRLFIALLLVASLATFAGAQRATRQTGKHPVAATNTQALTTLQKDLEAAIQSMTSALPIYDGNRVRSIHAAHRALVMVDVAIAGTGANKRAKPKVTDHIPSKKAHGKYTAQQIAQSQIAMQAGLSSLNISMKDLQAAVGGQTSKKGAKVAAHIQTAINEANKAISIHQTA